MIEPWHVPLLAMTIVVLPSSVLWLVDWVRRARRQSSRRPANAVRQERIWTRILAVLTLILLGLVIFLLGPAGANLVTTLATAVSTVVSAALTVQAFLTVQELRNGLADDGGPDGGAAEGDAP